MGIDGAIEVIQLLPALGRDDHADRQIFCRPARGYSDIGFIQRCKMLARDGHNILSEVIAVAAHDLDREAAGECQRRCLGGVIHEANIATADGVCHASVAVYGKKCGFRQVYAIADWAYTSAP